MQNKQDNIIFQYWYFLSCDAYYYYCYYYFMIIIISSSSGIIISLVYGVVNSNWNTFF